METMPPSSPPTSPTSTPIPTPTTSPRIYGLGITTGTTPTTYSPDSPVIRGHMALFLARLYKQATGNDAAKAETPFTDISNRTVEQETAIGQIYRLGVTTGTSDTTYSHGDDVTRRQMASLVARIYRALEAITSGTVADAPTDLEVTVSGDDGSALEVNWTAPSDTGSSELIDYLIQWKTGDTNYTRTNQQDTTATSATFDDLTAGETYTFRVAARTAAGPRRMVRRSLRQPSSRPRPCRQPQIDTPQRLAGLELDSSV